MAVSFPFIFDPKKVCLVWVQTLLTNFKFPTFGCENISCPPKISHNHLCCWSQKCNSSPTSFCRWGWHWKQNRQLFFFICGSVRWDRFCWLKAHLFLSISSTERFALWQFRSWWHEAGWFCEDTHKKKRVYSWEWGRDDLTYSSVWLPYVTSSTFKHTHASSYSELQCRNLECVLNSTFSWVDAALWPFFFFFIRLSPLQTFLTCTWINRHRTFNVKNAWMLECHLDSGKRAAK